MGTSKELSSLEKHQRSRMKKFTAEIPDDCVRTHLADVMCREAGHKREIKKLRRVVKFQSELSPIFASLIDKQVEALHSKNDKYFADTVQPMAEKLSEKKKQASHGGKIRWAKDPKSAAKRLVKAEFDQWQIGKKKHKSGAAFAEWARESFPALQSSKVVEKWVTAWRKDRKKTKQGLPSGIQPTLLIGAVKPKEESADN